MNKYEILESLAEERLSQGARFRIADALIYIIKKLETPPNPEINMSADHLADGVGEEDQNRFLRAIKNRQNKYNAPSIEDSAFIDLYARVQALETPVDIIKTKGREETISRLLEYYHLCEHYTEAGNLYAKEIVDYPDGNNLDPVQLSEAYREGCVDTHRALTAQLADKDRIIEKGRLYQKDQLEGLHKKITELINENEELKKKAV